jgi:exodeoxyribonuclease-3
MKIASYNLFEGAEQTADALETFALQENIDILCLQEVNGWQEGTPSRLEQFAAATGLNHCVYGDSNTEYKLATFSRYPITTSRVYTEGLWHCAVQTVIHSPIGKLDAWNIHLNPKAEDARLPEARFIVSQVDPDALAVIMGDFNSLSESDTYPDSLAGELAAKGIAKFGVGHLQFDVMHEFQSAGLLDAALLTTAQTNTVPTPANTDVFHAAKMRLDYMLGTKALNEKIVDITVPKNDLTNQISDHYPVVCTFA